MRTLVFALLIFSVFSVYGIERPEKEAINLCEPSLLFSETFALEDPYCFSYTIVSEISSDTNMLLSYLNSHQDNTEQHSFRLSYYLRTKNFFSALITLIQMVNTGTIDSSTLIYEKEFANIIAGGIKESRNSRNFKFYEQRDPSKPLSIREFSINFFAVVSYLASQDKTPAGTQDDSDLRILSRSFQYMFSNFIKGIELQEDVYQKTLFNRLLKLKNGNLLESYLEFFFYFSKKTENVPNYRQYRLLKDLDAVASFDEHMGNRMASGSLKKLFASFYLDNIEKMPRIKYSDYPVAPTNEGKICKYLNEREKWLSNLILKDPQDIKYNESVRIVENCPGSFQLPFVILDDKIVVESNNRWIVDIAVALKYLIDNDIKMKDANTILRGAVRSSLSKIEGSRSSQFADLLYFFYYTDQSPDLLFALYSKQLGYIKKDVPDTVNWAVDFLSSALF